MIHRATQKKSFALPDRPPPQSYAMTCFDLFDGSSNLTLGGLAIPDGGQTMWNRAASPLGCLSPTISQGASPVVSPRLSPVTSPLSPVTSPGATALLSPRQSPISMDSIPGIPLSPPAVQTVVDSPAFPVVKSSAMGPAVAFSQQLVGSLASPTTTPTAAYPSLYSDETNTGNPFSNGIHDQFSGLPNSGTSNYLLCNTDKQFSGFPTSLEVLATQLVEGASSVIDMNVSPENLANFGAFLEHELSSAFMDALQETATGRDMWSLNLSPLMDMNSPSGEQDKPLLVSQLLSQDNDSPGVLRGPPAIMPAGDTPGNASNAGPSGFGGPLSLSPPSVSPEGKTPATTSNQEIPEDSSKRNGESVPSLPSLAQRNYLEGDSALTYLEDHYHTMAILHQWKKHGEVLRYWNAFVAPAFFGPILLKQSDVKYFPKPEHFEMVALAYIAVSCRSESYSIADAEVADSFAKTVQLFLFASSWDCITDKECGELLKMFVWTLATASLLEEVELVVQNLETRAVIGVYSRTVMEEALLEACAQSGKLEKLIAIVNRSSVGCRWHITTWHTVMRSVVNGRYFEWSFRLVAEHLFHVPPLRRAYDSSSNEELTEAFGRLSHKVLIAHLYAAEMRGDSEVNFFGRLTLFLRYVTDRILVRHACPVDGLMKSATALEKCETDGFCALKTGCLNIAIEAVEVLTSVISSNIKSLSKKTILCRQNHGETLAWYAHIIRHATTWLKLSGQVYQDLISAHAWLGSPRALELFQEADRAGRVDISFCTSAMRSCCTPENQPLVQALHHWIMHLNVHGSTPKKCNTSTEDKSLQAFHAAYHRFHALVSVDQPSFSSHHESAGVSGTAPPKTESRDAIGGAREPAPAVPSLERTKCIASQALNRHHAYNLAVTNLNPVPPAAFLMTEKISNCRPADVSPVPLWRAHGSSLTSTLTEKIRTRRQPSRSSQATASETDEKTILQEEFVKNPLSNQSESSYRSGSESDASISVKEVLAVGEGVPEKVISYWTIRGDGERAMIALREFEKTRKSLTIKEYNKVLRASLSASLLQSAGTDDHRVRVVASGQQLYEEILDRGWVDAQTLRIMVHFHSTAEPPSLENAKRVLAQCQSFGVTPDAATLNALVHVAVANVDIEGAFDYFRQLKKNKHPIPASINSALLRALRQHQSSPSYAERATEVIDSVEVWSDSMLFGLIVDVTARLQDTTRLRRALTRFQSSCGRLTVHSCGALIKAHGKLNDCDKALYLWKELTDQGLQCDSYVHLAVLDALVSNNRIDEAISVLADAKRRGYRNSAFYSVLIKGCASAKRVDKAIDLLEEMISDPSNRCSTITFNTLINSCVTSGRVDKALTLWNEMIQRTDFEPDVVTFSTIVKGYVHKKKIDKALETFVELKNRQLTADTVIYNNLLEGVAEVGDENLVDLLMDEMLVDNLLPSLVTMTLLVKFFGKRLKVGLALLIWDIFPIRYNFTHDDYSFTAVISALLSCMEAETAMDLLEEMMAREGNTTSNRFYGTLVNGFIKCGRTDYALFAARGCTDNGMSHTLQTLEKIVAHLEYLPESQLKLVGGDDVRQDLLKRYKEQYQTALNSTKGSQVRRRNLRGVARSLCKREKPLDGIVNSPVYAQYTAKRTAKNPMKLTYRDFHEVCVSPLDYDKTRAISHYRTRNVDNFDWQTFQPNFQVIPANSPIPSNVRRQRNPNDRTHTDA